MQAEEQQRKEREEYEALMLQPKFCYAGESNDPKLVVLPKEEELDDDPEDQSHPNANEHVVDPETLEGTAKALAKSNWAWKFRLKKPDADGNQFA